MSKEMKVGLFVVASLVIFLATFVYVDQLSGVRVQYRTYFTYAGGVDPGSAVRFGGMKVGSVTAIRPWHQDPTKIEMLMEVRGGVPVNADSVATLTSISPLGDRYLEISTGSNHAPRIRPDGAIPSKEALSFEALAERASELIPEVQATLKDMQKNIDQVSGNAQAVLANIQSMTNPENQRNFSLLLSNAREMLDKESPQIDRVLQNLDRASTQASGVLSQAGDTLNTIQSAARNANATLSNANKTVDEIREPVKTDLADLQKTMADAQRLIADMRTVVSSNRYSFEETLENFRAASENLRELTASVRQRPWTLLRGKPAPDRPVPAVATTH